MRFLHTSLPLARMEALGRDLGSLLRTGDVVLLEGPLGAGKTTLVRAMAEGLGIDSAMVSSPTFVVINQYPKPDGGELVHVDAYRLSGPDDLDSLGWDRIAGPTSGGILAVEWPERLGTGGVAGWGGEAVRITLHQGGESSRDVTLDVPESWRTRAGVDMLRPREATVCPVTGRSVPADSPTWPFADERARMADLYRWMSGQYSVEAEEQGEP